MAEGYHRGPGWGASVGYAAGEKSRMEVAALASAPFQKQPKETQTLDVNLASRFPFNGLNMTGFPKEIDRSTVWN